MIDADAKTKLMRMALELDAVIEADNYFDIVLAKLILAYEAGYDAGREDTND